MEEACDECTQNCLIVHKRLKEPSYVDTFFKVMFGGDFSKVLLLPPKFARRLIQQTVGKSTELEDSSGEKWRVKFKTVDGSLAFEKGWNKFATDHQLKIVDFLVFHFIKNSHFVVLMYGQSGCPELRHLMRGTQEHNNLNTEDCSPLCSDQSDHSQQMEKKLSKKKKKSGTLTTNKSPKNSNHLVASLARPGPSGSDKETGQISDPWVENTTRDETMVPETSGLVKETSQRSEPLVIETNTNLGQFCLVDNDNGNNENIEDECRKTNRSELLISKTVINLVDDDDDDGNIEDECRKTNQRINSDRSDGGRKNNVAEGGGGRRTNVAAGGGGDETWDDEFRKMLEKRLQRRQVAGEKREEIPSETACNNSNKKRLRNTDDSNLQAKISKKEPVSVSKIDSSGLKLQNGSFPATSPVISPTPKPKSMQVIKKEPTKNHDLDGLTRTFSGCKLKDKKTDYNDSPTLKQVKPEPFDPDEAPPPGSTNASFSAVMTSYKYLELPDWVKMRFAVSGCGVILLKNGVDFWPVFYQKKTGVQGLIQGWGAFAKAKGIKLGDKCEFVPISQATSNSKCNTFSVNVTR